MNTTTTYFSCKHILNDSRCPVFIIIKKFSSQKNNKSSKVTEQKSSHNNNKLIKQYKNKYPRDNDEKSDAFKKSYANGTIIVRFSWDPYHDLSVRFKKITKRDRDFFNRTTS